MPGSVSRRTFLKSTGAVAAAAPLIGAARPDASDDEEGAGTHVRDIKKAVKLGMIDSVMTLDEKFRLLKDIGYDGVEVSSPNRYPLPELLAARDASGLPIHGVVGGTHWRMPLSHPEEGSRVKARGFLETALRDAKQLGADSVLLVPAVVNNGVAYDEAYERSQEGLRAVLPLAAELEVRILIENVWNDFLLSPLEAARYIDELESPWVGWYFDVGNVVNYGWPEQWIRILGSRIGKIDIKEYSRAKRNSEGPWAGFQVKLLEGDCGWPAVMSALDDIGFSGWATAELPGGDEAYLRDVAERMDRIFAS